MPAIVSWSRSSRNSTGFDAATMYGSHRFLIRLFRKLFNPLLKLLFNPNTLIQVIDKQTKINALYEKEFYLLREKSQRRDEVDVLYYELVHNLVLELTRVGIENRNVKMRLESLSSRMDFDERRARALEGVVQYRTGTAPAREPQPARPRHEDRPFQQVKPSPPPSQPEAPVPPAAAGQGSPEAESGESNTARRRRRRRRGRRGGRGRTQDGTPLAADAPADGSVTPPHGDPTADAALTDAGGESDFESDSDSGEDEGPDPSAQ